MCNENTKPLLDAAAVAMLGSLAPPTPKSRELTD
jgi:hypothetical protein